MYILNANDVPDAMMLSICRSEVIRASSRAHFHRSADLYITFASPRNLSSSQMIQIYQIKCVS
ncbi:hypothetical protein MA16_Dca023507 [Dendrobium catenatum]|uniref:Uncharacterized protein n=1 Tax=Dendrobium catenatum TaxID=906689 RepID=A0A2I0XHD8_9ASPA|nr:hypothetical protein MA16_Dca023507 [Dendrobium catenatum]